MHEPYTAHLERSPTTPSLAPRAAGLVAAPDCRGVGGQRGRGQSVDGTGPRRRSRGAPASATTWGPAAAVSRATGPLARPVASRPHRLRLSRRTVDPQSSRRHHPPGIWCLLSSASRGPPARRDSLEPAKACPACSTTRRSRDCAVARGDLACHQKGAQARQHTILFIDESGSYPLPGVVRTYAPVGQTPILREWWTRDHLSAISAISPEGKLYFQSQDRALDSGDVVAFLEHLLREVSGRMVLIWNGAPIHRSHVIQEFLANGAAQRLHLERLPAYAPELNPGEGLWQQLKGVELRHVCFFDLPHLHRELRAAVKRVRRKPRIIQSFFRGAKL